MQKAAFENKKFRIDFLIDRQLIYMRELENELRKRHEHISLDYDAFNFFDLDENASFVEANFFCHEKDEKEKELIEAYQANLIRYQAIKKLSVELDSARLKLHKAMKTQARNLSLVRDRVKWLENEIETVLLSNKNINFPSDSELNLLRVEKMPKPEIKIEEKNNEQESAEMSNKETAANQTLTNTERTQSAFLTEHESHMAESQAEKDEMNALMSKWEKKSNGSTDSLLDSDNENLDDDQEEECQVKEREETQASEAKEERVEVVADLVDEQIKENVNNVVKEKSIAEIDAANIDIQVEPNEIADESLHHLSDLYCKEEEEETIENNDEMIEQSEDDMNVNNKENECEMMSENTSRKEDTIGQLIESKSEEVPFYMKAHSRFQYTDSSRCITAADPTSYHRLAIALTDSYIDDRMKNVISSRIPILESKQRLERDDLKFLKLSAYLENVSKKICKSSELLFKFNRKEETTKISLLNRMKSNLDAGRLNSAESLSKSLELNQTSRSQSSRLGTYEAPQLLPALHLPHTKKNSKLSYPRVPIVYAANHSQHDSIELYANLDAPQRLVNQYNLSEQTKLKLYSPISRQQSRLEFGQSSRQNSEQKEAKTEPKQIEWSDLKPDESPFYHSGLRFEKLKSLLRINLKSKCLDEKLDAIKHLGLLKLADNASIYSLKTILENPSENELIKLESAKSLVLLGYWSDDIFDMFHKCLSQSANETVRKYIMKSIIEAKNPQYSNIETSSARKLVSLLESLASSSNESIALDSCICLGKLGAKDSHLAVNRLNKIMLNEKKKKKSENEPNTVNEWHKKTLALETLVKLFDVKDSKTINYMISQAEGSPDWVSRCSAVKLLSYLGPSVLHQSEHVEIVYKLLETRLAEDPISECRLQIGRTIKELGFYEKILNRAIRNLESLEDDVRIRAVLSIEMLEAKQPKLIEALIDMLELDESERVRVRVLKALFNLAANNVKVLKAFNNLEKSSKIFELLQQMREQQNGVKRNFKSLLLDNDAIRRRKHEYTNHVKV